MIERVISGGQVGVDIAALRAAKGLGIETGGSAPADFQTRAGPNLELRDVYGLTDSGLSYAGRTELNVYDSDATLRVAVNWSSYGELATAKWIRFHAKPSLDVSVVVRNFNRADGVSFETQARTVASWLKQKRVSVLNVAGNADPRLEAAVERYLTAVLTSVQE